MKSLRKIVKSIFYKYYHINPRTEQGLQYACNGRIVRSLTEDKKKYCAAYVLDGMK